MSDETLQEIQSPKSLILEIIERLTRVETRLETVETQAATKADLAELRMATKADFKQMESHLLKWLFGIILGCFAVLGAFLKYF